jgi:hypothetical protein
MRVIVALPKLFFSIKFIVNFTSNNTRIPIKSSQFNGIPYMYISYENIIRHKTKKTTR